MVFSKIKSLFQNTSGDTFIGIIDENGFAKGFSDNQHVITFSFCAYKKNDEVVQEREAVVHAIIPNTNYNTEGLTPLSIVKISGEQVSYHGQNRINLSSIIKTGIRNNAFQKIIDKRLEPIPFESEVFGTFLLDRSMEWFKTKTKWNDQEVDVFLFGEMKDLPQLELQAIQLFETQKEWDQRLKDKVSSDLLELKNETWIEEDETPVTKLAFQQQLTVESIQIHEDGEFQFWYNDGDLFWGHSISLDGNIDGRLDNAGLQG